MQEAYPQIVDRLQVIDVLNRYGRAMDTRDWKLMDDVFVEDAVATFPSITLVGRRQIVDTISAAMKVCDATHHIFTNYVVDVQGDTCAASMYVRAFHSRTVRGAVLEHDYYGSYTASLVRTTAGWRVREWAEHTAAIRGASQKEFFAPIDLPDGLEMSFQSAD